MLLLDEPLGALDLKLRRQMQDELKAIQKRVGTAFVHVTHDQEEAMALADHVVVMNHGRIEDEGAPERVYARPATRFAATFMGESTIVPGQVDAEGRIATALGLFQAPGPEARRRGLHRHQAGACADRAGHPRDREGRGLSRQLQARHGDAYQARRTFDCWRGCRPGLRSRKGLKSRFASIPARSLS